MLIEALISIALLATVLGLVLTTIGRARSHAALNNDRLEALHLARQQLEIIRQWTYDSPNLSLGAHTTPYNYIVSSNNYFSTNYIIDVTLTVTYTGALSQVTTGKLVTSMCSALHHQ